MSHGSVTWQELSRISRALLPKSNGCWPLSSLPSLPYYIPILSSMATGSPSSPSTPSPLHAAAAYAEVPQPPQRAAVNGASSSNSRQQKLPVHAQLDAVILLAGGGVLEHGRIDPPASKASLYLANRAARSALTCTRPLVVCI